MTCALLFFDVLGVFLKVFNGSLSVMRLQQKRSVPIRDAATVLWQRRRGKRDTRRKK